MAVAAAVPPVVVRGPVAQRIPAPARLPAGETTTANTPSLTISNHYHTNTRAQDAASFTIVCSSEHSRCSSSRATAAHPPSPLPPFPPPSGSVAPGSDGRVQVGLGGHPHRQRRHPALPHASYPHAPALPGILRARHGPPAAPRKHRHEGRRRRHGGQQQTPASGTEQRQDRGRGEEDPTTNHSHTTYDSRPR